MCCEFDHSSKIMCSLCLSEAANHYRRMRTQVAKWGNSLGVRIPKAYADELGLSEGATVEVKRSGRKLILMPTQPEYELSELVSGITLKNRHEETIGANRSVRRLGEPWPLRAGARRLGLAHC
jgi:antitoxin MazE